MPFSRYAVYVTLPPGPLAEFGAAWLGWDAASGLPRAAPQVPGLPLPAHEITQAPRKYGLHATIKPPFRLAQGQTAEALRHALAALCQSQPPVTLDGLALTRMGGFLALTPVGDTTALNALAARTVADLDAFRAPPDAAERARRRKTPLNPTQTELLARWGYPHVMQAFRFHITLTGRLHPAQIDAIQAALHPQIDPLLPRPFAVNALTLCGEAADGRFHQLHHIPLGA